MNEQKSSIFHIPYILITLLLIHSETKPLLKLSYHLILSVHPIRRNFQNNPISLKNEFYEILIKVSST